jgi:hypothetical protein
LVRQQTRGVVRIEHAVAGDVVGVCGLSLNLGKRSSFVFLLLTVLLILCEYI